MAAALAGSLLFILLYTRNQRRSATGILTVARADAERLRGDGLPGDAGDQCVTGDAVTDTGADGTATHDQAATDQRAQERRDGGDD